MSDREMTKEKTCSDCSGFVIEGVRKEPTPYTEEEVIEFKKTGRPPASRRPWISTAIGWCQLYHLKKSIDADTPMCGEKKAALEVEERLGGVIKILEEDLKQAEQERDQAFHLRDVARREECRARVERDTDSVLTARALEEEAAKLAREFDWDCFKDEKKETPNG